MSFTDAKYYQAGNHYTMKLTKEYFKKYYSWINWTKDEKESILDVGSGPGNTVRHSILPQLPPNMSRIVVSDVSAKMVEVAKDEFADNPKVSCEILDIGSEISVEQSYKLGTFDHVTSFFCFQWVANQEKSMENVYSLLKPGGDCFFVIVGETASYDALASVCEKPRWKKYFIGWHNLYPFPYNMKGDEAIDKAKGLMKKAGFVEIKSDIIYYPFDFINDWQKDNFIKILPSFVENICPKEQEEILQERLKVFDMYNVGEYRDNSKKITKPNSFLIMYGKKI